MARCTEALVVGIVLTGAPVRSPKALAMNAVHERVRQATSNIDAGG
jgi:hypothetical protein